MGPGHGAEAIVIGCACALVMCFFLGVGIWQQKVALPRRARELMGEMSKERMEKNLAKARADAVARAARAAEEELARERAAMASWAPHS